MILGLYTPRVVFEPLDWCEYLKLRFFLHATGHCQHCAGVFENRTGHASTAYSRLRDVEPL
jgi:hypothetical protein